MSHTKAIPDEWIDTGNERWVRNAVRVTSDTHEITEWDDLGDKNRDYYMGLRNTVIDPALYAVPVCKTHHHGTWWMAAWDYNNSGAGDDKKER